RVEKASHELRGVGEGGQPREGEWPAPWPAQHGPVEGTRPLEGTEGPRGRSGATGTRGVGAPPRGGLPRGADRGRNAAGRLPGGHRTGEVARLFGTDRGAPSLTPWPRP